MINAGKYNHKIEIYETAVLEDASGFQIETPGPYYPALVLSCYAAVKTTKGITLIKNDSDFEKAYTNFTIRFPNVEITRDMIVQYRGKQYTIEYLNNVDEAGIELEMQCKEITH